MGNNIITHLYFFPTFSHPPHIYSNFQTIWSLDLKVSFLSTFCYSFIFGFPSSIFFPSLCLSHQYEYVQV